MTAIVVRWCRSAAEVFLKAFVNLSASLLTVPRQLLADDPSAPPASWNFESPLIQAPAHVDDYPKFRDELIGWRTARQSALGYSDPRYRDPSFQWVSSNFACCFLMLWDERIYDRKAGVYTVESFFATHDLEDARAYARWAGKRLPSEEQWQYAAQGPEALKYPWGNDMDSGRCNGGQTGTTMSVHAFPKGRSAFGCFDMCGNTWEWTESERTDGRTRYSLIRGGWYHTAQGSHWYMDGGPRPNNFAAKFLLMWPGLDRCAAVGFRCIVDLA